MEEKGLILSIVLIGVVFLITLFYCWILFQILQRVPKENQQFPSWFVWLFVIPWLGFVFQWLMLPYGIPNALKKTYANNQDAVNAAETLFKIGLGQVILTTLGILTPINVLNQILAIAGIVLWILYWVKIVKFRNTYMTMAPAVVTSPKE